MRRIFIFTIIILSVAILSNYNNQEHSTSSTITEDHLEAYMVKGKEIASATFSALSGQLQAAMQEGGVPNALAYCNLAAYPITDSLASAHNASVRRTSSKVRNPNNQPTAIEKEMLVQFDSLLAVGQTLGPVVRDLGNQKVGFYSPIFLSEFCTKCHGTPGQTITKEDYQTVLKLYPQDQAIGYNAGDFRGIWSIEMNVPNINE